jgi:hypothetical protein
VNILILCNSFQNLTGSEIYFYELSIALSKLNCQVSIKAKFTSMDKLCFNLPSHVQLINDVDNKYDLILISHASVTKDFLVNTSAKKIFNIIHSEIIDLEFPLLDQCVDEYISVRPSIQIFLKKTFNVNSHIIYNPFDFKKWNQVNCSKSLRLDETIYLFAGTIHFLRIKPLYHLLKKSMESNFKVLHIGTFLDVKKPNHPNFEHIHSTDEIYNYFKYCDVVSGINFGRTSIEGIITGKRLYQYDVDCNGEILDSYWYENNIPLKCFNREYVAKSILNLANLT